MAGYVGGGGIGALVLNYGYNRFNFTLMYSLIVVLIIITQCKDEAVMAKDIISIMDMCKATGNSHLEWFERLLGNHLKELSPMQLIISQLERLKVSTTKSRLFADKAMDIQMMNTFS